MQEKVKKDPVLAEDIVTDHNGIELLLFIRYSFTTFRLILTIFNISFFVGMFWNILCELSQRVIIYYRES